jgi:glycosyltransferase involved in cell wall biosynthesis
MEVSWVAHKVSSRLRAEYDLHRSVESGSSVLCFHGLPPLLPTAAHVAVFLQNRLYLDSTSLAPFRPGTRLRLLLERFLSRALRHRVGEYIVQTPAMSQAVQRWNGKAPLRQSIRVLPFIEQPAKSAKRSVGTARWDFVYVADGEAHKNHMALLSAWLLMAQEGLRPSLALTLGERDHALQSKISIAIADSGLKIRNFGELTRDQVAALYTDSRALIFPSVSESFGMPLIEAKHLGVPIIASERDFVRDVCEPVQTFDPDSAVSIARAVKRFLNHPDAGLELRSPADFWSDLLGTDRR